MKKRLTAILAIAAMVVTLVPSIAFAGTAGNVAKIGSVEYPTLNEAIKNVKAGETITILRNVDNATGISVPSNSNFTVDFAGFSYTLTGPGAGSKNTETNGFQLLKDSTIVFKNGELRIAKNANDIKRVIQNYANLTLDNVKIYAENQVGGEDYAVSVNNGDVVFKGNSSIITSNPNVIAFDVCKFASYPGATVTFEDNYTGTVNGQIVFDSPKADTHKLVIKGNGTFGEITKTPTSNANIVINGGTFNKIDDSAKVESGLQATVTSGNASKIVIGKAAVDKAVGEMKAGDVIKFDVTEPGTSIKVPEGAKVENASGSDIVVNGTTLADGTAITVQKPVTPSTPETTTPEKDKNVKTGDDTNLMLPVALVVLSLIAMAAVVATRRRHN